MGRSLLHDFPPRGDAAPVSLPFRHPIFAKGFRPFFLLAAAFAGLMVPLWLLALNNVIAAPTYFLPAYWHAHEMVFGFAVAVIAGFLLTAVGNWTQRETATGRLLAMLSLLWIAGRVAMFVGITPASQASAGQAGALPFVLAALDLAFLPALIVTLARPLLATNNRRNFVMLAVLTALFAANVMTHLDALGVPFAAGWQRRGALVAVDVVILLILVIAGRVIPMFTRNATRSEAVRSVPALEVLTVLSMAALVIADATSRDASVAPTVGALALVAGVVGASRAAQWETPKTFRHPLLWILHVGYFWAPIGLLLRGAGIFLASSGAIVPPSMSTHALTAGSIGALTLGMMARVALGHTGRVLEATRPMTVAFALVTLAAIVRVASPMLAPAHYNAALIVTAVLWTSAFAIYAVVYAPILTSPRVDGRPG